MIICIVGQTCTGKTTLSKTLQEYGVELIKQYTTRPRRKGEPEDSYHFVTEEEFKNIDLATYTSFKIKEDLYFSYGYSKKDLLKSGVIVSNNKELKQLQTIFTPDDLFVVYLKADEEIRIKRYLDRENDLNLSMLKRLIARFEDEQDYNLTLIPNIFINTNTLPVNDCVINAILNAYTGVKNAKN